LTGRRCGASGRDGRAERELDCSLSTQRSSLTTVETNYHFALNDLIGASGSFYDLHSQPPCRRLGWNPVDDFADRFGNRVRVCLLATPDLWRRLGGHKLPFARISFNGGEARFTVFSGGYPQPIDPIHAHGFIGPQYSENQGFLVAGTAADNWSLAGGAEGGFRDQRTSVLAGYSGASATAAVFWERCVCRTYTATSDANWFQGGRCRHRQSRQQSGASVALSTCASSVTLTSVGVSLERNVGKSVGFRLGYSHDLETG